MLLNVFFLKNFSNWKRVVSKQIGKYVNYNKAERKNQLTLLPTPLPPMAN